MFDQYPLEKGTIIEREVSIKNSSNELKFKNPKRAGQREQHSKLHYSQFEQLLTNLNNLHLKSNSGVRLVQNQYLMIHFGDNTSKQENQNAQPSPKRRLVIQDTQKILSLISNCRTNQSLMEELKRLKSHHAQYQLKTLIYKEDVEDFGIRQKVSIEKTLQIEQLWKDIDKDQMFIETLRLRNNFFFVFQLDNNKDSHAINVVLYTSQHQPRISNKLLEQQVGEVEYNVEIEFEQDKAMTDAQLETIEDHFGKILRKVLMNFQQSPQLVTQTELHDVQNSLMDIFADDTMAIDHMLKYSKLYVPPVSTIGQQNMRDIKRYSVTDKADGQRQQLIFLKQNAFLVQPSGQLTKLSKISSDATIVFDCEVVYIKNNLMILVFDVVYSNQLPNLKTMLLEDRVDYIVNTYNNINNVKTKLHSYKDLRRQVQEKQISKLEDIGKLNETFVQTHFSHIIKTMNEKLSGGTKWVFLPKIFLFPCGIDDNETMLNIDIIRNYHIEALKKGKDNSVGYETDGEILTPDVPFNQLFKLQHAPLKIKPIGFNTIDLLVQFQYNNDMQFQTYTVNDEHFVLAKIYCKKQGLKIFEEIPRVMIRLRQKAEHSEPYDIEGNAIDNGSVVEFVYISDAASLEKGEKRMIEKLKAYSKQIFSVNDQFVIPLRTRLDKTDRQTPNAYDTIMSVIQTTDIYQNIQNIALKEAGRYYQINEEKRKLTKSLRLYHSFVKWILIQLSGLLVGGNKKKLNIMDVGSGQGGDLTKYNNYIGHLYLVEPSQAGLEESAKRARNMKMDMKQITFINQSAQDPIKVNGERIDFFNCQMMIHYLFQSEKTFDQFLDNIRNLASTRCTIAITYMDAEIVAEAIASQQRKQQSATRSNVKKEDSPTNEVVIKSEGQTIYQIKVLGQLQPQFGQQVDVMTDFTDAFYREFLVFEQVLTNKLKSVGFEQVLDVNFLSDYEIIMEVYDQLKGKGSTFNEDKIKQNKEYVTSGSELLRWTALFRGAIYRNFEA